MEKTYKLNSSGLFFPMSELEDLLDFQYLSGLVFETPKEQLYIEQKIKNSPNITQSKELGSVFYDKIRERLIPDASIRWINEEIGYGVFAEEDIEACSYAGEYTGVLRRNDMRRYFTPIHHYGFQYPLLDDLGRNYLIDAEKQGNITRFYNHSEKPNLKPAYALVDGIYHAIFISIRRIRKGEQLSYTYKKGFWNLKKPPVEL